MNELYTQLKVFGHVKANEPMNKHTTFKIGGPVDYFLTIDSTDSLVEALRFLDGEGVPYFILGGGSNMLVRDEGFRGVAVRIKDTRCEIQDTVVQCAAGCSTVEAAQKSIAAGLTGFEWGVGVPGTIGGAVRGNAGAMGGEMKDSVDQVEIYRDGEIVEINNKECQFGYRDSVFKHRSDIILRVYLRLKKTEDVSGMKQAMDNLMYRNKTQPQGYASIGCIFKNIDLKKIENSHRHQAGSRSKREKLKIEIPEEFVKKGKISAGWLIDQSGMKGVKVGNAQISERHGNFIVNLGGATAQDVLSLIEQAKEKVYDTTGVEIEEEIQII
ncbi:MAG: UDP-N-acetylmuramate dehydrogenase [Candidatus Magasanikbacteria bacterium]|nr:UDP-N-acetylmuramate dehydrogenase [Candidatus Magasanikbacteria bacterium]